MQITVTFRSVDKTGKPMSTQFEADDILYDMDTGMFVAWRTDPANVERVTHRFVREEVLSVEQDQSQFLPALPAAPAEPVEVG